MKLYYRHHGVWCPVQVRRDFSCWLDSDGNCSGRFRKLLAVYVVFKFRACGVIKTCLLWYLSADASWKNVRSLCVVSQLNHKPSVKPPWSPSNEPHCLGIPVSAFVFTCHPSSVASACIYQSVIGRPRWNLQSFTHGCTDFLQKRCTNNISCVVKQLPTRGLLKDLYFMFCFFFSSYETYLTIVVEVTSIILISNDIRYNIRLKVLHLVLIKPYWFWGGLETKKDWEALF